MSLSQSVQEYVARQPSYTWKRNIIRALIRTIGFHVLADVRVYGVENIPTSGPTILMMNHIGLADPVVCMGAVTQRFVVPMSKIENLSNPLLAPFVRWWGAYTVNRDEVDRKALMNSIELIKSGQLILIAPEGTRNPTGLVRPKDGLAFVATKANAVIVPAAVSGSQHFTSSIKRLRRAPISVTFGKPFRFKTTPGERVPRETLQAMSEEAMYQLALAQPDVALRGVYTDTSKATTEYLEFV
ncbi:MAG: lysophospholipid acyltransferase family protein [Chloroflexota bacterium]|nr:lysophospholipid acyltransferase family protein [Chloroflexota bacterium]